MIYLNQLEPASLLMESYEMQQEELASIEVADNLARLSELAKQLGEEKATLLESTVRDIRSNQKLQATFDLISQMRTNIVTANT